MTDMAEVLKQTQIPVVETAWLQGMELPTIVFGESLAVSGPDRRLMTVERDITVEYFSERVNKEHEQAIELIFEEMTWEYSKERWYYDDEHMFATLYRMTLKEKKR